MSHVFQDNKNLSPDRTGVRVQQVYDLLLEYGDPMTCKEIGTVLGIDITKEENLKDISNRCGYLREKGLAERVGPGTYRAIKDGPVARERKPMTMTEPTPLRAVESKEKITCDQCGKPLKSQMGLRAHMTRSHPSSGQSADDLFDRSGQALEAMFPDGIPASRVIELANLQKAMLKAMKP